MSGPNLYSSCVGHEKRDAVHIAVIPVKLAETLDPGTRVCTKGKEGDLLVVGKPERDKYGRALQKEIGVISPFIQGKAGAGYIYYLCLFPNTVVGMTHHWEHPDIDSKEHFKKKIKDFAESIGQTYDSLIDVARNFNQTGDWTYDNTEAYKDNYREFDNFWKWYEIVTGEYVGDKSCPFTCSC